MENVRLRAILTATTLCLATAPLAAQLVEVIYCNVPGQATNVVPGLEPARFRAGTTNQFERPFRSPDGRRWILTARITDVTAEQDQVLIVGSGVSGTTVVQKGTTQIEPGRVIDAAGIDPRVAITDDGTFAFATNLTGNTADDEVIVVGRNGIFTIVAREGWPLDPVIPGARLGAWLDTPTIDNETHRIAFRALQIQGVPGNQSTAVLVHDATGVAIQTGVSIPQPGTSAWTSVLSHSLYCDDTCARWIAAGQIAAPANANDVVVVSGMIVAREGQVLVPSFTAPVSGIGLFAEMISTGSWFIRGSNTDGVDWIYHNNLVVGQSGRLVPRGFTNERFSDIRYAPTWFHMAANYYGDFVIGGTTNFPDPQRDAVLVWNNQFVFLRKGDPVDLDGNGTADDDTYIDRFNDEDGFLTEDGYFYFTCDIRKGPSPGIGQIFGRIPIRIPGRRGDMNCDGVVNNFDIDPFILAIADEVAYSEQYPDCYRRNGDINGDGRVDNFDIGPFVNCVQNRGCD